MGIVPMEGHGTDAYATFNRLAQANSETIIQLPCFFTAARQEEERAAMESLERPNQGRRRPHFRLFDAMSRRDASLL